MFAITSLVNAQESSGNRPPSFQKYEWSADLPNGIAFYMTLQILDGLNTEFGPSDPASMVQTELKLGNVESHTFVSQALTTLYLINTDVTAEERRIACQYAGSDIDKHKKYAALQQMYDVRKAVYDHYYDQTKANLVAVTAERLQRWMDVVKHRTTHIEVDFEGSDQQSGNDSTLVLATLCGNAD
ncbi:MAG TPA: hypothetical protein PKH39_13550 [Woeseiaceae bacterium]|nr:hypothetical protein [Woeseiaceae bacterium]